MSKTDANRKLALQFFEILNQGERPDLQAILSSQIIWSVPKTATPPYAGEHHGAEKVVEMMFSAVEGVFDAKGVHHEVLLSVAEGDTVVVETRMQADQPNGRHYDNRYVFIFEIREKQIAVIREHVDTAYAVEFFTQS